jgi:Holliday junction resolvase
MKAPLEKDIQRAILSYLGYVGAVAVRINSGVSRTGGRFVRFNSLPGCPDVLACVAGRFVAVEVKRPGERPTAQQQHAIDSINRAGGLAFVARSVGDVHAALIAEGLIRGDRRELPGTHGS